MIGWRKQAVFIFILLLAGVTAQAAGTPPERDRLSVDRFCKALHSYYRVPETEIEGIMARGISWEELPVVFFIAENGRVATRRVVEMRLSGRTWPDVAYRFGLTPDAFYVPLAETPTSPPFGALYGRYGSRPKREWKTLFLDDRDVINLVNLKFLSDNYRTPPERVIGMASSGKDFLRINEEMEREKAAER